MSTQLSPESESFLADLVARQVFTDHTAAIEAAVTLLKSRYAVLDAIALGQKHLREGRAHSYVGDELDRFLADIEQRQRIRHPAR
jgi:hypothetical protein